MTRFALVAGTLGVLFASPSLSTQAASVITGRVVAESTGDPIANARVTVPSDALGAPVVLTDSDGRFSLSAPAGPFRVVVTKSGYGRAEIALTTASQPATLRMRAGAVIAGRITDGFGEPVPGARVSARGRSNGNTTSSLTATSETDDRGEYRLANLAEGSYIVSATTTGELRFTQVGDKTMVEAFSTTYYPNASDPSLAQDLRVNAGETRSRIDFVIQASLASGQPFSVVRSLPASPPFRVAGANQTSRPTGAIRGRVVSTDGRVLPYAQVGMLHRSTPPVPRTTHADGGGAFEFLEVPAGTVLLFASKPGYFLVESSSPTAIFSSLEKSGVAVDVADGERKTAVEIKLARWATLTGRVLDDRGEAVEGAAVQLMQVRYERGRRRLIPTEAASRLTNDLGAYRLYGLAPGQYIVSAAVGDVQTADLPGYVRSYFPGTSVPAQAQFVTIGRSQDAAGIDVVMSPVQTFRIAGRILNAAGEPSAGGSVTLTPGWRSSAVTSVPVGARLRPDGTFEFPNVPAGQYNMQVSRGRSNTWTEGEFAAIPVVVVDRNVTNLTVRTSAGSSIAGRIVFDSLDPQKRPAASDIEIVPVPADPDASPANVATANIASDWTFRIQGLNGPRRLQLLRTLPGWALKEIRANGIDVTDRPIPFGSPNQSLGDVEVVLTDRISELAGAISDESGRPTPRATAIVFATDRDRWYPESRFLKRAFADDSARFSMTGLPSGSYYAAAVVQPPADGADAWQDPAFLDSLVRRATAVSIAEGERRTVGLRIADR